MNGEKLYERFAKLHVIWADATIDEWHELDIDIQHVWNALASELSHDQSS